MTIQTNTQEIFSLQIISFFDIVASVSSVTIYVYDGTIKKIKRGEIKIKFGSNGDDSIDVEVDKNGKFSSESFLDKNNLKIYYQTGRYVGVTRNDIVGARK